MRRWPFHGIVAACLGNLLTGGTGSGKTSGPFPYIMRSFLRAGCGGTFLCDKKDADRKIIESKHREQDLIVFREGEQAFNFLSYQANRGGHAVIENLVSLILEAAEITARNSGQDFFDRAIVSKPSAIGRLPRSRSGAARKSRHLLAG